MQEQRQTFIQKLEAMKKLIPGVLGLLLFATSCCDDSNDNGTPGDDIEPALVTPALTARISEQASQDAPFTGILEIFPCISGTSDFYGNYFNGKLSVFSGFYTIVQGEVFGENNRLIHLPIGEYNMVYWGTPKHEEPIDNAPEMSEPGITEGVDLSTLYFSLRPYGDGTYKPVFDLVHAVAETQVGTETLHASLYRVSAGLIVNLTQKDNTPFPDNIQEVKVQIGSIAEKLNFYTAEPVNQTKTVRFGLTRSEDGLSMSNPTVMLFPSAPNPTLEIFITLSDNSIHKLSQTLNSSLSANTLLTLNIVIGRIISEGNPEGFTITDWNEQSETIEFPDFE